MFSYFTGSSETPAVDEAKAESEAAAAASEFDEAKAEEDAIEDLAKTFEVTKDELSILRAELASGFPDDCTYLSDAYILSVASKPYSKDPKIRRPLDYSQKKLNDVMSWRKEEGAPEMATLVDLANKSEEAAMAAAEEQAAAAAADAEKTEEEEGEQKNPAEEKVIKAKALSTALNNGSIYFHGFTKDGRPVLWVRTNRKPWYPDVDAECNALMVVVDAGIQAMPDGITDFICVADSSYPPPPNPTFMIKLLKALVKGYPDRLQMLYSAPISSIVQFVMNLLLPLMPGRLASKVVLQDSDAAKTTLAEVLEGGEADIPTFMGGTLDHDQFYPEESKCPNRGEGSLKFDYYGMVERLQAAKKAWTEAHPDGPTSAPVAVDKKSDDDAVEKTEE